MQRKREEVVLEAVMKKFLEPQSVAIIGASATPGKGGNDIISPWKEGRLENEG
jgi:acyl-CoA synthetase (NDP forming)